MLVKVSKKRHGEDAHARASRFKGKPKHRQARYSTLYCAGWIAEGKSTKHSSLHFPNTNARPCWTTTSTSINVVGGGGGGGELQNEWHQQRGAARKISFSSTLSLGPAGMMLAFAEELINRASFREVEAKRIKIVDYSIKKLLNSSWFSFTCYNISQPPF